VALAMDRLNTDGGEGGVGTGGDVRARVCVASERQGRDLRHCAFLRVRCQNGRRGWTRCDAPWLCVFAFRCPCPTPAPSRALPERAMRLAWMRCEIRSAPWARARCGLVHRGLRPVVGPPSCAAARSLAGSSCCAPVPALLRALPERGGLASGADGHARWGADGGDRVRVGEGRIGSEVRGGWRTEKWVMQPLPARRAWGA
jgi:hypothetical protein